MNANTVCSYKWTFPIIDVAQKKYRMCCKTPFLPIKNINENDLVINTEYQIQRRFEMLTNVKHHDCDHCWTIEDSGGISFRNRGTYDPLSFDEYFRNELIDEFNTTDINEINNVVSISSDILQAHKPYRLEIKLGNLCDLQCVYCSREWSSKWAVKDYEAGKIDTTEYKELNNNTPSNFISNVLWKWLEKNGKKTLKHIGLIGGEPSITPDFYVFSEKILQIYQLENNKDVVFWVVTNLNTPRKHFKMFMETLTKLSQKFKVHITISMEAIAKQAEFIRTNLDWDTFQSNLHILLSQSHIFEVIAFNPVLNILAVPKLVDFLKWHFKLMNEYNVHIRLNQSVATSPSYLFPFKLPQSYSIYVKKAIDFLYDITYIHDVGEINRKQYLTFLQSLYDKIETNKNITSDDKIVFFKEMSQLETTLRVNFCEIFPELAELYTEGKTLSE